MGLNKRKFTIISIAILGFASIGFALIAQFHRSQITWHSFGRNGGRYAIIAAPGPAFRLFPQAINNKSVVVGYYLGDPHGPHGFIWRSNSLSTSGLDGLCPAGVNDQGVIVGYYWTSQRIEHGFISSSGRVETVDCPLGLQTELTGINNRGQILGRYFDRLNHGHVFIRQDGKFEPINDNVFANVVPSGISNNGDVVGFRETKKRFESFEYGAGAFRVLPQNLRSALLVAVSKGIIVGTRFPINNTSWFRSRNGVVEGLTIPTLPGHIGIVGTNDRGQMVGGVTGHSGKTDSHYGIVFQP